MDDTISNSPLTSFCPTGRSRPRLRDRHQTAQSERCFPSYKAQRAVYFLVGERNVHPYLIPPASLVILPSIWQRRWGRFDGAGYFFAVVGCKLMVAAASLSFQRHPRVGKPASLLWSRHPRGGGWIPRGGGCILVSERLHLVWEVSSLGRSATPCFRLDPGGSGYICDVSGYIRGVSS